MDAAETVANRRLRRKETLRDHRVMERLTRKNTAATITE